MAEKGQAIFQGKYLRVISLNGWEYVERTNCSGVVIVLAVTDANEIILIEQYRIPVGASVIEFPAGLVGDISDTPDESLETAARRELLEETGYEAETMEFLTVGPPSAGLSSETLAFYRAKGLKKIADGGGDHTESITVYAIPLDKADEFLREKLKSGCLIDPKIYSGLYFAGKK